jgi:hypothetical protein
MKRFLSNTVRFLLLLPLVFATLFIILDYAKNHKKAENALFIWGDSQAYQGIDLPLLGELTEKMIYTAARHGAGVYDFLVFAEKIPEGAEVMIAVSKTAQLRRKQKDYNMSGFSFGALKYLGENNYSFMEILQIARKNIRPKKLFIEETYLFEYSDSLKLSDPIDLFKEIYSKTPAYLHDKQNIMLEGIQALKDKGCSLTFIEFPYHPILSEIESGSGIRERTDAFKTRIGNMFQDYQTDTILIEKDRQVMHDLTHLNAHGASVLSRKLARQIIGDSITTLYVVL